MRNRIYITSIYEPSDIGIEEGQLTNENICSWTNQHRNVLTFVPSKNGLYLNGKKYRSVNEAKNSPSANSVFRLAVVHIANDGTKNDVNYIRLVQSKLYRDFSINSLVIYVNHTVSTTDDNIIKLTMCVGERVQIFTAYDANYEWEATHPNSVSIDRNLIIHALSVVDAGEQPTLILKYKGETVCKVVVSIYSSSLNIYSNNVVHTIMNSLYGEPGENNPNYEEAFEMYKDMLLNNNINDDTTSTIINVIDNGSTFIDPTEQHAANIGL